MTRVVGLTGGIGCGKSTVAGLLAGLGAARIDADALAREAVLPGMPALAAIRERFGDVLLDSGELDRPKLGALVFSDETARKDLNGIVHPEVARLAMERISELRDQGVPLIIYDVPLLYENGLEKLFEAVIVVWAPPEVQRARIAERDGLSAEEIEARIAAQMSLDEKVTKADFVIDNSGSLDATELQVRDLFEELRHG